jgi:hypothetical protein
MAFRDSDGNFISADSADRLGEVDQERIPEEKVCPGCFHKFFSILMHPFTG